MVDPTFADGLNLLDDRSFIVCLGSKAIIFGPATQIAGLDEPAGMLINPVLENVEEKWKGWWHEGPLRSQDLRSSKAACDYKEMCKVVTVNGGRGCGVREGLGVAAPSVAELLFRKR
jgi:hypothetical protein